MLRNGDAMKVAAVAVAACLAMSLTGCVNINLGSKAAPKPVQTTAEATVDAMDGSSLDDLSDGMVGKMCEAEVERTRQIPRSVVMIPE